MKTELSLKHEGNISILEVREGDALPLKEQNIITIIGTITTIFNWLIKRVTEINEKLCHILIDKNALTMTLIVDESNHYKTTIVSKLQLSDEYKKFGINSEKVWECFDLANFIKMNRSFFQDKITAMQTVSQLRDFKAKVNNEIEKFKDDRANKEIRLKQTVESNLPPILKVKLPIFKEEQAISLDLEIEINPDNFGCSFICPDATDFINEQTDLIFDEQINKIQAVATQIAILYV